MAVALQITSIILSIALIILILLQVKGGALGSLLGGDAGGGDRANASRPGENTLPHHHFPVDCLSRHRAFRRGNAGLKELALSLAPRRVDNSAAFCYSCSALFSYLRHSTCFAAFAGI